MKNSFLERIGKGPLLADGGMGTLLHELGVSFEHSFDGLNLDRRELVEGIHRKYIVAGAELIETNTFGANRHRLGKFGLEDKVDRINLEGVKIARNAREIEGREVFVAGSMGPLGQALEPLGHITYKEAVDAFREQAESLLAAGVDLYILETFAGLAEVMAAIEAVRAISSDIPIVAMMTFTQSGKTYLGHTPKEVAAELSSAPIDVLGVNCSVGPQPILAAIETMRTKTELPLAAMPNAGLPGYRDGRLVYLSTPAYLAEYAGRFADAGVSIIGGCCGTTPDHLKAMAGVLASHTSGAGRQHESQGSILVRDFESEIHSEKSSADPVSGFLAKLQNKQFAVSVELAPPRGTNPKKLLAGAKKLKEAGTDAINVPDSPMARVRMACWSASALITHQVGVEVIMHFTCRDRNLMGLQSDLMGAYALGVRNIMAITGDPPRLGDFAEATGVYDVDAIGLVKIIKALNRGTDFADNPIGSPTRLSIGVAVNPTAEDWAKERDRLLQKIDSGAQFAFTQPLYQISIVEDFLERTHDIDIPVCLGILPLLSHKHAQFLHHEVPGIQVPDSARNAMEKAGKNGSAVGQEIALELLEQAYKIVDGAYLMPSFGRYETCIGLVRMLKEQMASSS